MRAFGSPIARNFTAAILEPCGKRQQRDIACLLDRHRQPALVPRSATNPCSSRTSRYWIVSIFSTQNLQTFLRRKNFRPPGPPGPPGPPVRGPLGRGPRDSCPPPPPLPSGRDEPPSGLGELPSGLDDPPSGLDDPPSLGALGAPSFLGVGVADTVSSAIISSPFLSCRPRSKPSVRFLNDAIAPEADAACVSLIV
jgi:hypothetical protein